MRGLRSPIRKPPFAAGQQSNQDLRIQLPGRFAVSAGDKPRQLGTYRYSIRALKRLGARATDH